MDADQEREQAAAIEATEETKKKKEKPFSKVLQDQATGVAKSLAGSALTAVGGAVLAPIFNGLFPPQPPAYFGVVYDEVRKIVDQSLARETIDQISGTLHNVGLTLQNIYRPDKLQRVERTGSVANLTTADRQALSAKLQPCYEAFISGTGGMLGTLQDERHDLPGFNVYLMGVGLHLAVLQEMAAVDPEENDPAKTSMGRPETGGIANMARDYAHIGRYIWGRLQDARLRPITDVEVDSHGRPYPAHGVYWTVAYWDMDTQFSRIVDREKDLDRERQKMKDERNALYDQISSNLTETYHHPLEIIPAWESLIASPLRVA